MGRPRVGVAIPENQPDGVSSTIGLAVSGIVRRIKVRVDIVHTFIGDLVVELFSPTGRRATLHARQGGTTDNLVALYDSDRPGELSTLVGQPMQGNWVLRLSDRAAEDVGTLKKWSIELEGA